MKKTKKDVHDENKTKVDENGMKRERERQEDDRGRKKR